MTSNYSEEPGATDFFFAEKEILLDCVIKS